MRVVEQRNAGVLQQALLIAEDDSRRLQLEKALNALVPADDARVERIQVVSGEVAVLQFYQGTQRRRQHGEHGEDHRSGIDV